MGEDTARDLIADQPNPLLVMLTIPVAIFGKPPPTPKLVTAPANAPDDTVGYAPKPLALGPPLSDLMGEDLSRVSAAAVTQPDAGTFAPPVTENRKDLLPFTQPLVAVTAGIPTAIAAPIVASVPLFAAIAQGKEAPYTAGAPVAHIVTANTVAAPAEMRPIAARATPAETAFRLRAAATAGSGEISASAINAPLQVPDRAIPKPLAIQPKHGPDEAKATHTPKPESAADSPVLAAIRLPADDVPQPLAVVGADPPKPSAAVVAPPNAAPPPAPAALPPQLSAGLITLAKTAPDGPVKILLNPEELGSLRFEIHQKADQLRVVLSVERPETMDLLRRNADQLLDEFRAAGFSGASLSFGQWDQQSRDPRAPPAPPTSPQDQGFAPPPVPKTLHPPLELALPTGLDMRL